MLRLKGIKQLVSLVCLFVVLLSQPVFPCTSLFLPSSPDSVLAANLDWATGTGIIYINKRDVQKTATFVNYPFTPLQWTSKYMSLTLSETGLEFPWEGMNEKGLAINSLMLPSTRLPVGSTAPAVNGMQFMQYLLDTSATTAEAIANAQSAQIAGAYATSQHYFLCDATGACATVENLRGSLVVHQGSTLPYAALANNNYQASLYNLSGLLAIDTPSQILALTGQDSLTRFEKAAILSSQYTPQSSDSTYAFSSLQTVREINTQWSLVFLLASSTLQWETTGSPTIKSVSLNQFDPHCSTGVQIFHVNSKASGDVTSSFYQYTAAEDNALAQSNVQTGSLSSISAAVVEAYPAALTRCTEENISLTSSANPSSLGQNITLTAKVMGTGTTVPTGTVVLQNGSTAIGTGALDSTGAAHFNISFLPLGSNSLTVTYAGDSSNASAASPPLVQTVYAYSTQTAISSSANPTIVNQPVTLMATVTSPQNAQPTGSVVFSKNGVTLGTVALSSGQAALNYTFGSEGSKSITAAYSGDANFAPSLSSAFSEGIGASPTATTLSSSSNPSLAGQQVTLTATVSSSYTASGMVTFYNGSSALGTVDLVNGQASLSFVFYCSGLKPLTAVFSSSSAAASTSAVLVQTVQ